MSTKILAGWLLGVLILITPASAQTIRNRTAVLAAPLPKTSSTLKQSPALTRAEQMVIQKANEFRVKHGRPRLRVNVKLMRSAREYARYLSQTGTFSHTADGREPWDRMAAQGYDDCIAAENIAWEHRSDGFTPTQLADALMKGWEHSPPHRRNLLDPDLDEFGVGVAYNADTGRYYAVQDFGRPRSEQTTFTIANETGAPVHYDVGGKDFTIRPHYQVTHYRCRPPELTVQVPSGSGPRTEVFHPHNGAHYVIERNSAETVSVAQQ